MWRMHMTLGLSENIINYIQDFDRIWVLNVGQNITVTTGYSFMAVGVISLRTESPAQVEGHYCMWYQLSQRG